MIFKKILNFFDKEEVAMPEGVDPETLPKYGRLYKLENELLPFRYIYKSGDDDKGVHRFKHHQLKEYIFEDFGPVEREANEEEIRIYNKIKDHINELAREQNDPYYN